MATSLASWTAGSNGTIDSTRPVSFAWGPDVHAYNPGPKDFSKAPAFYRSLYALQASRAVQGPVPHPILLCLFRTLYKQVPVNLWPQHLDLAPRAQGHRDTYYTGALLSYNGQRDVWR
jgi:hypothetical protein